MKLGRAATLDALAGQSVPLPPSAESLIMPGNENGLDPDNGQDKTSPRRGPADDVRPDEDDLDPRTRGGNPQGDVEDRPSVGTVKPEDYPEADRADSRP